ncbi:hypothetical protein, partial [Micromonospora sp. KC207]|uniref:hypothetical protein n=1 Tax=Micromonospora sp. KC207 TaxID=2530377 RepID=UPI001A9E2C92
VATQALEPGTHSAARSYQQLRRRFSSDVRPWLAEVHEKTLAVESEAVGVAQAFYEEIDSDHELRGWMTVRGVSGRADRHKGHADHRLAARHAALAVERLLPYLRLAENPR